MSFVVTYTGQHHSLPIDRYDPRKTSGAVCPTRSCFVSMSGIFKRLFGDRAEWVGGAGPYATRAYCGYGLTIVRHAPALVCS